MNFWWFRCHECISTLNHVFLIKAVNLITTSEFHVMKLLTNQNDSCLFIKSSGNLRMKLLRLELSKKQTKNMLNFCL